MNSFRFGKHPPKHDYRTLRLKNYLSPDLPPPPESYDVLASRVYDSVKVGDPTVLFPMDGNDAKGDCTIAAMAHAITVNCALIKKKLIPDVNKVLKLYLQLTNGIDSGLAELDVLNYWRLNGALGDHHILGFSAVDVKNILHIKQAIFLFGGVYIGFQVQEDCLTDFQNKKPWTEGKLTTDGHAVYAVGYDNEGVTVLTWGNTQKGTWGWWNECVDEAYAILPSEAQNQQFAGVNLAQLKDDLSRVAQGYSVGSA